MPFQEKQAVQRNRRPNTSPLILQNTKLARSIWGITAAQACVLKILTKEFQLSVVLGDLNLLDNKWYVTHSGLLRLARRNHCAGIRVRPMRDLSDPAQGRWVFRATVHKSRTSKSFIGNGDADPSNVSPLVRGAEMRVAETRAVNRALRKAYGIGLCSIEELGWPTGSPSPAKDQTQRASSSNGNGSNNGQPRLRDRLPNWLKLTQQTSAARQQSKMPAENHLNPLSVSWQRLPVKTATH